ncbi:hypothetical protein C1A38_20350 [Verrucosispora sp. ts21]|nr:hypothetical protein C1A38_20350 [Verrucosispora sp. ts21]
MNAARKRARPHARATATGRAPIEDGWSTTTGIPAVAAELVEQLLSLTSVFGDAASCSRLPSEVDPTAW